MILSYGPIYIDITENVYNIFLSGSIGPNKSFIWTFAQTTYPTYNINYVISLQNGTNINAVINIILPGQTTTTALPVTTAIVPTPTPTPTPTIPPLSNGVYLYSTLPVPPDKVQFYLYGAYFAPATIPLFTTYPDYGIYIINHLGFNVTLNSSNPFFFPPLGIIPNLYCAFYNLTDVQPGIYNFTLSPNSSLEVVINLCNSTICSPLTNQTYPGGDGILPTFSGRHFGMVNLNFLNWTLDYTDANSLGLYFYNDYAFDVILHSNQPEYFPFLGIIGINANAFYNLSNVPIGIYYFYSDGLFPRFVLYLCNITACPEFPLWPPTAGINADNPFYNIGTDQGYYSVCSNTTIQLYNLFSSGTITYTGLTWPFFVGMPFQTRFVFELPDAGMYFIYTSQGNIMSFFVQDCPMFNLKLVQTAPLVCPAVQYGGNIFPATVAGDYAYGICETGYSGNPKGYCQTNATWNALIQDGCVSSIITQNITETLTYTVTEIITSTITSIVPTTHPTTGIALQKSSGNSSGVSWLCLLASFLLFLTL